MIWQKPASHQTSAEELRIASEISLNWEDPEMKITNILLEGDAGSGKTQLAKALSADLQLPYTKVTCFSDMDKTDIFGALLPIVATDDAQDSELLEAIYQTDSLDQVLKLIQTHYAIDAPTAKKRFAELISRIDKQDEAIIQYKFYPSEIVRAMEKGYLLEIQEPTVIRDASVLVALNSALEPNGMLNIPTGIIRRHTDCVVVITTNRNYQGNRPLNESLRDRMQHAERMDLPAVEVMAERASAKTGIANQAVLLAMAEIIRLLDETSKTNAIKGVAGMRSYLYWVNTLKQKQDLFQSLYPKVFYKLTTEPAELTILEEALEDSGLLQELRLALHPVKDLAAVPRRRLTSAEADERNIYEEAEQATLVSETVKQVPNPKAAQQAKEQEQQKQRQEKQEAALTASEKRTQTDAKSHSGTLQEEKELDEISAAAIEEIKTQDKNIRKTLNQQARKVLADTIHAKEGLIIHRPDFTLEDVKQGRALIASITPQVDQLAKQLATILENEESNTFSNGKYYGSRFNASKIAAGDYRNFDKRNPPHEQPSLAVAIRVDESGSMMRNDRIEFAKSTAVAVALFSEQLGIPLMIYGDTADQSSREKTSIFSYKEFDDRDHFIAAKIATMKPRQNNRDGVALKLLAEALNQQTATTKLLINISDGQPKALPDYTGAKAKNDIQSVLAEYERQGVIFLAAAIGEDRQQIRDIYGESRFLDITDLQTFPEQLLRLIARYL